MTRARPRPVLLLLPALAAMLLIAAGCPKRAAFKGPGNSAAALDSALVAFEAGRFAQAEEALTWVIFNFPGSREAADAQYWLAESHFRRGDYHEAQVEYEFYLRSFPNARYQQDANYKLGLAWLRSAPAGARDQQPLNKAQELLSDFLLLYPDSELRPEVEQALAEIERRKTGRDFDVARL
ncbi:MAG TPA: outer membrane protein assembly factor BamD, partial [candidate division WOR-3 bacterium]|nr:outer membrane protein assembly factor BamD [candidate division WOR-3 bacterium]